VTPQPTGTVTMLFTDIEGSTRLLAQLGAEGYRTALELHSRLLREAFEQHEGYEVDSEGDAFFVAFASAQEAVAAASEAQKALVSADWPEGGEIRVRMGLHTGEPLAVPPKYVGMDVHKAARIMAAGHGGQVLLSEATQRLAADVETISLGEHRLKDLLQPEPLYQLRIEGLPAEFQPLATPLDTTNLPVVSIPLVGRERELGELVGLLSNGTRLLTLTGPGGTGKTRLALQVAAELAGRLRDGVFWIPLGGLSDPGLVPSEIARTVGAPDELIGFLRGRELLILLDNFEHLLDAVPAVSDLLGSAGDLRFLVTSRTPLRVSAEQEYRLEPLPDDEAATLFVQRARGVGRELTADRTVAEICRRLDGLPLAIELAAARTKLLSPERLLERLGSVLPLLTSGARDAPERQRTLRATIEWSYDLLDPPVQELFVRLAVFAGVFPLAAAEEVAGADLDGIEALVDSSLLKPIGDDSFLMLETIREYADEKLDATSDVDEIRRLHAAFFAGVAEDAYRHRFDDEATWAQWLELHHTDLRRALDWLTATEPDGALALAGALGWFWLSRGHLVEGDARVKAALAGSTAVGFTRARASTAAGALSARIGLVEEGRVRLESAVEDWRKLGDRAETAAALESFGWLLVYDAGDDSASLAAFEEAHSIQQDLGDRAGETRALVGVCQVLVALGEVERAEALSQELLERGEDDIRTRHFAIHFLADCSLIRGDCAEAEERYRESLRAALELGDVIEASFEVQGIAMARAGKGDSARALELAASVEALWRSLGSDLDIGFWARLQERYLGAARTALGPADAEAAHARGLELSFDAAVALALQEEAAAVGSDA
jgi:predicted ATPase/class 3 adenylate cyclase